jgi:ribonuclease Z
VAGADILFIECAFLEADAAHGARKNHLTARQAGTLARRARVNRLEPCHFSTRYSDHGDLLSKEAQAAFSGLTDRDAVR